MRFDPRTEITEMTDVPLGRIADPTLQYPRASFTVTRDYCDRCQGWLTCAISHPQADDNLELPDLHIDRAESPDRSCPRCDGPLRRAPEQTRQGIVFAEATAGALVVAPATGAVSYLPPDRCTVGAVSEGRPLDTTDDATLFGILGRVPSVRGSWRRLLAAAYDDPAVVHEQTVAAGMRLAVVHDDGNFGIEAIAAHLAPWVDEGWDFLPLPKLGSPGALAWAGPYARHIGRELLPVVAYDPDVVVQALEECYVPDDLIDGVWKPYGVPSALDIDHITSEAVVRGLTFTEAALRVTGRLRVDAAIARTAAIGLELSDYAVEIVSPYRLDVAIDDSRRFRLNAPAMVHRTGLDPENLAASLASVIAAGVHSEHFACPHGDPSWQVKHLLPLHPSESDNEQERSSATVTHDDIGSEFRLVTAVECEHLIQYTDNDLADLDAKRARFDVAVQTVSLIGEPLGLVAFGRHVATMLADAGYRERLRRHLVQFSASEEMLALGLTTDVVIAVPRTADADRSFDQMETVLQTLGAVEDLQGQPLGYCVTLLPSDHPPTGEICMVEPEHSEPFDGRC